MTSLGAYGLGIDKVVDKGITSAACCSTSSSCAGRPPIMNSASRSRQPELDDAARAQGDSCSPVTSVLVRTSWWAKVFSDRRRGRARRRTGLDLCVVAARPPGGRRGRRQPDGGEPVSGVDGVILPMHAVSAGHGVDAGGTGTSTNSPPTAPPTGRVPAGGAAWPSPAPSDRRSPHRDQSVTR